jgi:hypothetical protein
MAQNYIPPDEVISPKLHWNLIAVIDEGKEGASALAIGRWDGVLALAMRWNGDRANPIGHPQTRGLPTWFIIPKKYREDILCNKALAPEKVALARGFFPAV